MPPEPRRLRRRICFVTGTRAEYGLMEKTLRAIARHPKLKLQIIVTGMHLDRSRGNSARGVKKNWKIDHIVPWDAAADDPVSAAKATGAAISKLAYAFNKLKSDIVLIVGDRVEAFAAASAAHLCGKIVAHVHGGDRAMGQVDDSLRHAITKLSHVHFPATMESLTRIRRLGEEPSHIHPVGSPGIDGILEEAISPMQKPGDRFAILVLHPANVDPKIEYRRAQLVLRAVAGEKFDRIVVVYPNNDPGSSGIIRAWRKIRNRRFIIFETLGRGEFLGLLKSAKVLVGNSSSGIIEAASFGVPVVDIGERQLGRERGKNVVNVPYSITAIQKALRGARRKPMRNIYGGGATSRKIAAILASVRIDDRLRRKLITY